MIMPPLPDTMPTPPVLGDRRPDGFVVEVMFDDEGAAARPELSGGDREWYVFPTFEEAWKYVCYVERNEERAVSYRDGSPVALYFFCDGDTLLWLDPENFYGLWYGTPVAAVLAQSILDHADDAYSNRSTDRSLYALTRWIELYPGAAVAHNNPIA